MCKDKVSLDKWVNVWNLQQHRPLNKITVVATSRESCLINRKTTPNYWILCQAYFQSSCEQYYCWATIQPFPALCPWQPIWTFNIWNGEHSPLRKNQWEYNCGCKGCTWKKNEDLYTAVPHSAPPSSEKKTLIISTKEMWTVALLQKRISILRLWRRRNLINRRRQWSGAYSNAACST